ncbi:conserved hypothetical protein [Rippkaea orientalis PCC 8801]|uniref:Phycobilisome protein n=1 Tax=Rippkaea orientalis (strain PCC 8801 / RF-1) TaxID=41431 RepID=B7K0Y9_RIPO1|nr:phycobilisome protein [Rippkaea orientalis]ACK65130.1 conserved hypothetical protein [Rippkaea orientalis PCC 8801]
MQTDFEELFYQAEDHYLQAPEIDKVKTQVSLLGERLETYKLLRDQEIAIFQPIADSLLKAFPQETISLIEKAIKHWLCVMRYGAMAMLLNNPDFFRHRLLEWLTDIIHAHEMVTIEQHLYELLEVSLQEKLDGHQFQLIKPFLSQAQTTLLDKKTPVESLRVGETV